MKEFMIGAGAIVLAGAAFAQTQPQPPPAVPHIAPMADRTITRDEVVAKVREHFAQLDTNRDGFLTREEADAGRKIIKQRFREKLGERREHRIQSGDPGKAFDRLDTNKDGVISRDEFAKAHEQRIERRIVIKDGQPLPEGIEHAPGMPGMPHEGMRMMRFGMPMGGQMFEMADTNKDGRISLQEATEAALRHFDMADTNRDGRITPEERMQMHRQMIEKHRAPKAG